MHSARVTTTSLALCGLYAAAALGFALGVKDESARASAAGADAAAGAETLFDAHCAGCHEVDALRAVLRAAADRARARVEWRALLEGHGNTTEEQDALLVEWLATTADTPQPPMR
jgi:mono/diheme cytochrome c family protein